MKTLILTITTLFISVSSFAATESTFECQGESQNLQGAKVTLKVAPESVTIRHEDGATESAERNYRYAPRARKNYVPYDINSNAGILVEQALLDGGYELKGGGRGGYIRTELYANDTYVRGEYLCKLK